MKKLVYDPRVFWEERLLNDWSLKGVGHMVYSQRYNSYLYRAKIRALLRAVNNHQVRITGSAVCDVGSGTGFWIHWYLQTGASHVTGLEISQSAAKKLAQKYPQAEVYAVDICNTFPLDRLFDIVNAFDVFYHITLEKAFNSALSHIAEHLAPSGYLFLTDLFSREDYSPAKHVCFHNLSAYERVLFKNGCKILSIIPMYGLLNGTMFDWLQDLNPKLRTAMLKIEEVSVPLLYKLDGLWLPRWISNLKIMVAQRKLR